MNLNFLCEERIKPLQRNISQHLTDYELEAHRMKRVDAYD